MLQITPEFNGHLRGLKIFPDGTFELDVAPAHSSVREASVVFSGGDAKLPVINNRKEKRSFDPPQEHRGKPIQTLLPTHVISLRLEYYLKILNQALEKFGHKTSFART